MTTGMWESAIARCRRRSRPLIPVRRKSSTRQRVFSRCADLKNSSAEANVWTPKPTDRRRFPRDRRSDSSSSTTETADLSRSMSMQDAVLNLCRVKLRDQLRLERLGYLEEYPQYPNGTFGDAVPRGGNAGGGGQPGWILKCKDWETDPNAYIYFTIQEQNWERTCQAIGKPEWAKDPANATAHARQPHIFDIFAEIEKWLADKTKFEAVEILRKFEVPCAPVLSMKEIAYDPALRASGSVVEVQQERRGSYLTVGSPIKFSGFTPEITGAPLLGEHTDEVLTELGYSAEQITKLLSEKVVGSTGSSRGHRDIRKSA